MPPATRLARPLLVSGCLIVALTGCSGTLTNPNSAPATTGATTANGEWTIEEAQAQYLAAIEPGNDAVYAWNRLANDANAPGRTEAESQQIWFAKAPSLCAAQYEANQHLIETMPNGKWPTSVRMYVMDFVNANAHEQAGLKMCADATTYEEVMAGHTFYKENESTPEAYRLRSALGLLPPS